MLGVLQEILCWVSAAAAGVLWALASACNLLIAGLGAFIVLIVDALPAMPGVVAPPDSDVLSVVNYILPLGGLVAGLVIFLTLWGAFLLIRIPLRWAKVV